MRWFVRILVVLVAAAVILVAGLFLVPNEQLARILENRLEAATGRDVTITGDVRPSLWPELGLRTGRVTIANADWAEGAPMLEADGLSVAVDLPALLSGDIVIGEITAIRPRLLIETAPDGSINWDVFAASGGGAAPAPEAGSGTQPRRRISLENLSLTDAAIRFIDRGGNGAVELDNLDMVVRAPDLEGPTDFSITYRRGEVPIRLEGRLERTADFIDGAAVPISASFEAAGSTLVFGGTVRIDGSAEGSIAAEIADTGRLLAAFGFAGVDLPPGLGRKGSVTAQLRYGADGAARLDDIAADLEGRRVTGWLAATFEERPRITGELSASAIDLSPVVATSGGAGSGGAAGWPRTPIDASALGLVDADIAFHAAAIVIDKVRLEGVAGRLTIDNARAVLDIQRAKGYGGAITGTFVANNRSGLSVRARAQAQGVGMRPLLTALAGFDRLAGRGDFRLDVLGAGSSVDAIMRSLKGDAALSVRDGEIFGVALAKLFLAEGAEGGSTIFDTLEATFQIAQGVARNDDLVMVLPQFRVTGKGAIDIGNQRIDYRLVPELAVPIAGRNVIVPVDVTGPWSDPSFRPDLGAAIQSAFGQEIEDKTGEVRETVKEKLGEALGVETTPEEDIEDAVKKKIEEEAVRGLFDLLQKN